MRTRTLLDMYQTYTCSISLVRLLDDIYVSGLRFRFTNGSEKCLDYVHPDGEDQILWLNNTK
jgi:hypothetical protein